MATWRPSSPVLVVDGSYTWFWGFEITNTSPNRSSVRGAGIDTYGHHNRVINLTIHDTGQGVGFWATSQADDSEVYGTVISHVGWEGGDRGHGHSLYVQNVNGTKKIADNIMFEGFSFGIHAYTENGGINNLAVTGNIVFNHGTISATGGAKANILFAGGRVAQNPTVVGNFGYFPAASAGRGLDVSECNNGTLQNNYLAGGTPLRIGACTSTVVTGNTLYGPVAAPTQSAYPGNFYGTTPSGVFVGIRPNAYEPGRANIAIFNWARHSAVPVDVAATLAVGTAYEVRDAQNFFGPPVATGVYGGGPITIPMTGLTAAPLVGTVPIAATHTGPEFGAFVLLPLGAATTPPPPAALRIDAVSPPAGSAAGGVTVTLNGGGFAPGATVQIGGVAATTVVVPNSSTASFVAPPHAPGPVDIVVTSAGQQADPRRRVPLRSGCADPRPGDHQRQSHLAALAGRCRYAGARIRRRRRPVTRRQRVRPVSHGPGDRAGRDRPARHVSRAGARGHALGHPDIERDRLCRRPRSRAASALTRARRRCRAHRHVVVDSGIGQPVRVRRGRAIRRHGPTDRHAAGGRHQRDGGGATRRLSGQCRRRQRRRRRGGVQSDRRGRRIAGSDRRYHSQPLRL